jgi:hypothetical protein
MCRTWNATSRPHVNNLKGNVWASDLAALDERVLVVRAQEGDTDAFEKLFRSHQVRVYNLVAYILGDRTEAEDVTQQAVKGRPSVDAEGDCCVEEEERPGRCPEDCGPSAL